MPVNIADLKSALSGKYLKAEDLDGVLNVTIKDVNVETVGQDSYEKKVVLYFQETEQIFPLNKTNYNTIKSVLQQNDPNQWIGQQISLRSEKVPFKNEIVDAIRVDPNPF